MSVLDEKLKSLDIEAIREYYYVHSDADVCRHFDLRTYMLPQILKRFSIPKKTKEQSALIIRNTILSKSCEEKQSIEDARKATCLKKYGCDNPAKNQSIREKISNTFSSKSQGEMDERTEKFRHTMANKSEDEIDLIRHHRSEATSRHFNSLSKEEKDAFSEKMSAVYASMTDEQKRVRAQKIATSYKEKMVSKYGVTNSMKLHSVVESLSRTCMEKYGVPFYCMASDCRQYSGSNSKPNLRFKDLLEKYNLEFSREFRLENFSYDFKVGNILIEIDPTATHNSTWSPFGNPISKTYHREKTECAKRNGYRCIHIFDWDDYEKVVKLLIDRPKVYARKCEVVEIDKDTAVAFLNTNHLQGYAKDDIRLGLQYRNELGDVELVSVMTFDKPRYNKKFDYELIRYCSIYDVVGGAEKLFKYFLYNYVCESVISYCDLSKFDGEIYIRLGFKNVGAKISRHWYNPSIDLHITDNFLRQRGFDQLFGESFGKGTSNDDLMLKHNFVEVYDCGQAKFEYSK